MNINENNIQKLFKISLLRSITISVIVLILYVFSIDPVDSESSIYIISTLCLFYFLISINYFYSQIKWWKKSDRYRFIKWYYYSFKLVEIVVWLAGCIFSYLYFENMLIALITLVLFVVSALEILFVYRYRLHFISVFSDYILVVNKKIIKIYPSYIAEIHYRNDILIFKLKNEKTIFINFLEVDENEIVKQKISEWLIHNGLSEYEDISKELVE